MYRTLEDFVHAWEKESAATQRIMEALTDASLAQPIADGHRTLGRIAWHIVLSVPEMMEKTGLSIKAVDCEAPVPARAAAIGHSYAAVARELLEQIKIHWTDQTLKIVDDMYGEPWPRGLTAQVLVDHQTHHRGQMTVLMRQAGLKVPGIYGPSMEDWAAFGGKAPEI